MKTINAEIYNKLTGLGLKDDACTLDEILDMLPDSIETYRYALVMEKISESAYKCGYFDGLNAYENLKYFHSVESKNPADAAGRLLAWCIKNGYVKVEDLNNEN